tara:strand:+ start:6095 stop:6958 length:864 start_codon:yes stop_codon:yes gene_type:complete
MKMPLTLSMSLNILLAGMVGYTLAFKDSTHRPPWERAQRKNAAAGHTHTKNTATSAVASQEQDTVHEKIKQTLEQIAERTKPNSEEFAPKYYYRKSLFEMLPDSNGEIVFLGDSITEAAEWHEIFPGKNIVNRGIGGDTTRGVLLRLNEVLAAKPQKLFLMIGINDLYYGNSPRTAIEHYREIVQAIRKNSPETELYVQSTLPVNNINFDDIPVNAQDINLINQDLKSIAAENGATFIDIASVVKDANNQLDVTYTNDGIHLNGKGYQVWAHAIRQHINPETQYSSL